MSHNNDDDGNDEHVCNSMWLLWWHNIHTLHSQNMVFKSFSTTLVCERVSFQEWCVSVICKSNKRRRGVWVPCPTSLLMQPGYAFIALTRDYHLPTETGVWFYYQATTNVNCLRKYQISVFTLASFARHVTFVWNECIWLDRINLACLARRVMAIIIMP